MALPPVILLHAFPVDARLWEDVEQQLREQGIEPIVPNLRGFGTNRDELPTEPNLDALADDVAALIEGTGAQSAVVAGVSMGGYVAMNLARRYPERVAGLVLDGQAANPAAWLAAVIAFLALSFLASATYGINDLFDLQDDRAHWSKKNRPIASGALPISRAMVLAGALLLAADLAHGR